MRGINTQPPSSLPNLAALPGLFNRLASQILRQYLDGARREILVTLAGLRAEVELVHGIHLPLAAVRRRRPVTLTNADGFGVVGLLRLELLEGIFYGILFLSWLT